MKAVQRRRGISTVIGQILVLAVVIILMTGVVVFYNTIVGSLQQNYKSTAQQAQVALKEHLLIEDIQFYTDTGIKKVRITVFNFGEISSNVAAVYINGIMLTPPPSNLIGQNQSVSLVWAYSWSSGGVYQVKVVTGRGVVFESPFSP